MKNILFSLIFLFCTLLGVKLIYHTASPELPKTVVFTGHEMTIDYRIIVGSPLDDKEKQKIQRLIDMTFGSINDIYNKWNPNSELSKLNRLKKGEISSLSSELENFLKTTDFVVKLTEGRFDPTVEPLQQLWKKSLEKGGTPSKEEVEKVSGSVGWNKIHFSNGLFYKDHDEVKIDLGGIAKGYCVDLLISHIQAAGYPDLYVEWGGEIRCVGKHPDDRPWNVFISRLGSQSSDEAIAHVNLCNQAIATSGDYQQQWHVKNAEGQMDVYSHIFDPITLKPLVCHPKSIASASVLADNCTLADGLATALMLFPTIEEAQTWAASLQDQFPNLTAWLVARES